MKALPIYYTECTFTVKKNKQEMTQSGWFIGLRKTEPGILEALRNDPLLEYNTKKNTFGAGLSGFSLVGMKITSQKQIGNTNY